MTGWADKKNGQRRTILWNEENRVKEIQDNGKSNYYLYDDAGERVLKRGQHGETFYINRFFTIRNGELGTKSIYAGNTRLVSKLVKTPNTVTANTTTTTNTTTQGVNGLDNGQGKKLGIIKRLAPGTATTVTILPPEEKDQFFYHGDHLGLGGISFCDQANPPKSPFFKGGLQGSFNKTKTKGAAAFLKSNRSLYMY